MCVRLPGIGKRRTPQLRCPPPKPFTEILVLGEKDSLFAVREFQDFIVADWKRNFSNGPERFGRLNGELARRRNQNFRWRQSAPFTILRSLEAMEAGLFLRGRWCRPHIRSRLGCRRASVADSHRAGRPLRFLRLFAKDQIDLAPLAFDDGLPVITLGLFSIRSVVILVDLQCSQRQVQRDLSLLYG
jgi:hypothetical protein